MRVLLYVSHNNLAGSRCRGLPQLRSNVGQHVTPHSGFVFGISSFGHRRPQRIMALSTNDDLPERMGNHATPSADTAGWSELAQ